MCDADLKENSSRTQNNRTHSWEQWAEQKDFCHIEQDEIHLHSDQ